MPRLPDSETWSPRYGLGDIEVKGEGIGDFAFRSFYIDLELRFLHEGGEDEDIFATFDFTNNEEALIERGYSNQDAKELAAAVDTVCKFLNRKCFFNPKYDSFFSKSPLK